MDAPWSRSRGRASMLRMLCLRFPSTLLTFAATLLIAGSSFSAPPTPSFPRLDANRYALLRQCEQQRGSTTGMMTYAQMAQEERARNASLDPVKDCGFTSVEEYAIIRLRAVVASEEVAQRRQVAANPTGLDPALKSANEAAWREALQRGEITAAELERRRRMTEEVDTRLRAAAARQARLKKSPPRTLDLGAVLSDDDVTRMRELLDAQVTAGDIDSAIRKAKLEEFVAGREQMKTMAANQPPLSDEELAVVAGKK